MDSNNGNSYTLNLRFPGFDEEWVEKNMEELCKPITPSFKLQSRDYLKAGKYPIVDQSQSLICGWTNDDKGLVKNVPVIVFGDHTCVLKYIDFPFIQGADGVKILSPKKDYDSRFVFQSFLANPVKPDGYKRHFSDFKEKTYLVPSPAEQQKIASCLSEMDNLISAQSQKVESLKTHKKGLMQQLFPQPGETTPQLRFSGFTGEWEEKKLGEIATFYKGKGISKNEVSDKGKTPCVRYGELYTYYSETIKETKSFTDIPPNDLFLSRANDVIIPSSGETKEDISTASCVLIDNIALGGDINVIRSSNNGVFLAYYLNNAKKNDIAKIAQGISIIHLYNEQLKILQITIPTFPEQQKIADCLSSLDEEIAVQQQKVEALKEHKKGLMQQLFPEPIK